MLTLKRKVKVRNAKLGNGVRAETESGRDEACNTKKYFTVVDAQTSQRKSNRALCVQLAQYWANIALPGNSATTTEPILSRYSAVFLSANDVIRTRWIKMGVSR